MSALSLKGAKLKSVLNAAGVLLALAGVVFVWLRLRDYGAEIDFSRFTVTLWVGTGALVLVYTLANSMLAFAWRDILAALDVSAPLPWSMKTYAASQLAKYVPGNIFHLAGRQALGMAAGVSARSLGKSLFLELALIAFAGGLLGILALPLLTIRLSEYLSLGIFAVVTGMVGHIIRYYSGPPVAHAFFWYLMFHAVSSTTFVVLIALLTQDWANLPWVGLCGGYIVAWLIGLLTPGAPAGVGVREAVLLFLFNGLVPEADLLLAIVLTRIVSVVGDVLFWICSLKLSTDSLKRHSRW